MHVFDRYDDINVAVESNLRKQAEVMHGIDANMQAFGDILQQNASSQQVHHLLLPSKLPRPHVADVKCQHASLWRHSAAKRLFPTGTPSASATDGCQHICTNPAEAKALPHEGPLALVKHNKNALSARFLCQMPTCKPLETFCSRTLWRHSAAERLFPAGTPSHPAIKIDLVLMFLMPQSL